MKNIAESKINTSGVITESQLKKLIKKQDGERCLFVDLLYFEMLESHIDYSNAIKFSKKSGAGGTAYFSKDGYLIKAHISAKDKQGKITKNHIFYYHQWLRNLGN